MTETHFEIALILYFGSDLKESNYLVFDFISHLKGFRFIVGSIHACMATVSQNLMLGCEELLSMLWFPIQ
jgi:hypothetical protein